MNRIIIIGIISCFALAWNACTKPNTEPTDEKNSDTPFFMRGNGDPSEILIKLETGGNAGDEYIDLQGTFFDAQGDPLTAGDFTINGVTVDQYGDDEEFYFQNVNSSVSGYEELMASVGSNLDINIGGGSFGDLDETISFAQIKHMSFPYVSNGEINKNDDLVVEWDPTEADDNSWIAIRYEGPNSYDADPELSPTNEVKLLAIDDDNGSFTIPSSELSGFPVGGIISFSLINAAQIQNAYSTGGVAVAMLSTTFFHSQRYKVIE